MEKLPIIVDTDPGIDDALALLLLYKHKEMFDIRLLCSTAGNNPINVTTNNIKYFAKTYFNGCKVAIGSKDPLVRRNVISYEDVHGKSGLGSATIPNISYPTLKIPSYQAMAKALKKSKEKITIITLGAMTNIAKLIINYPELKCKIDKIYAMIGSINGKGNITPYSECNAYFDADAFSLVANSDIPMIINPIEMADSSKVAKSIFANHPSKTETNEFIKKLIDGLHEVADITKASLFDLHSVMALVRPELYKFIPCNIDVYTNTADCGKCILTKKKNSKHYYQELKNPDKANKIIIDELFSI